MALILNVQPDMEHELIIDPEITNQNQFMYPAYQSALTGLAGMLKSADRWYRGISSSLYGYANNILAFSAPRGQGKTSSMMSFANYLEKQSYLQDETIKDKDKELWSKCSFTILDTVDPDMLQDGRSIVAMVLSYVYEQVEKALKDGEYSDIQPAKWLKQFQRCFAWFAGKNEAGSAREVSAAAYREKNDGLYAKKDIYELINGMFRIKDYQDYLNGSKRERNGNYHFLVLQLDDTDLGMHNVYALLEEVRQFLSLPNVLVLMAADGEQLRKLVAEHYCDALGTAITHNIMGKDDASHMAAKYVDKLIPASQLIQLPTINSEYAMQEKIYIAAGEGTPEEITKDERNELQRNLFALIYQKTGLVLLPHSKYLNNIVPRTLRGIRQLYRMLNGMSDCHYEFPEKGDFDWEKWNSCLGTQKRNLIQFENYFLTDWCFSKLKTEYRNDIRELSTAVPGAELRCAYRLLRKRLEGIRVSKEKRLFELLKWNQSVRKKIDTEEAMVYNFAIMEYLSILLNKKALFETIRAVQSVIEQKKQNSTASPKVTIDRDALKELIGAKEYSAGLKSAFWKYCTDFGMREKTEDLRPALLADAYCTIMLCNWEIWDHLLKFTNDKDNVGDCEFWLKKADEEVKKKIPYAVGDGKGSDYLGYSKSTQPGSEGTSPESLSEKRRKVEEAASAQEGADDQLSRRPLKAMPPLYH